MINAAILLMHQTIVESHTHKLAAVYSTVRRLSGLSHATSSPDQQNLVGII